MSDPLFTMEVSAVETLFEAGDVLENTVELLPSTVLGNVKTSQRMPTSQELAVLCQKYSSALGIQDSSFSPAARV